MSDTSWTNGGGDHLWLTAANWSGGDAPGESDDVTIDGALTPPTDPGTATGIGSLTIANVRTAAPIVLPSITVLGALVANPAVANVAAASITLDNVEGAITLTTNAGGFGINLTTTPDAAAEGQYADEADVADLVGNTALDILSDLSGGQLRDHANIQRALDWADAYLDSRLRALGYVVPLAGTDAETDAIMSDLAARLVVWRMNEQRSIQTVTGVQQNAPDIDDLMNGHKKYVDDYLAALAEGDASIVATITSSGTVTSAGTFGFSEAVYVRTTAAADENAGLN